MGNRGGPGSQQQQGHGQEQRQRSPGELQNAEQIDVRTHAFILLRSLRLLAGRLSDDDPGVHEGVDDGRRGDAETDARAVLHARGDAQVHGLG